MLLAGQVPVMKFLLSHGADVNQRTPSGTPLLVAVDAGQVRPVRICPFQLR